MNDFDFLFKIIDTNDFYFLFQITQIWCFWYIKYPTMVFLMYKIIKILKYCVFDLKSPKLGNLPISE